MFTHPIKVYLVCIWLVCLFACTSANNKPVVTGFSADSSSIVFSAVHPAGLLQVRNTPGIDTAFSSVISVAALPDENDVQGTERPFPGRITFTDQTIIFKPYAPFVKGKSYLVISYLNSRFGDAGMMLSGKLNHQVKPLQVVLTR